MQVSNHSCLTNTKACSLLLNLKACLWSSNTPPAGIPLSLSSPSSSQADHKSLPQRPDYLFCSVTISGFTPYTTLAPMWGMGVSFFSAENYGASTASWGRTAGPLKPLNLCLHLQKQKKNRVFPPSEWKILHFLVMTLESLGSHV